MKALQLRQVGDVALVEVEPPACGDNQLLIRTGAAIVCTSDLNDIRGNPFGIKLPVVLGHEGAGTVVAAGKNVKGFRPGDRVAAHPVHPCGRCANCQRGLAHLCSDMGHFGLNMPGTFAEYFVVRQDRARVIPDPMSFGLAALCEPVCVCLEALDRAQLAPGSKLLILGDGPFGLLLARLARNLPGITTVIAGRHDFRLGFARGAVCVNTRNVPDPQARLLPESAGQGYDAVILAVGSAPAARAALALLRARGRLVVFSAIPGETPLDLFTVHVKELTICGACNDADKMDEALAMLASPALGLAELITHRFPLTAYHEALRLAEHGREEAVKVSFTF